MYAIGVTEESGVVSAFIAIQKERGPRWRWVDFARIVILNSQRQEEQRSSRGRRKCIRNVV